MEIKDQVALITGASKRVGKALAIGLANEGAKVAIHTRKPSAEVEKLCEEIGKKNQSATYFCADFRASTEVDKMFDLVKKRLGAVRILVNNASVFEKKTLEETNIKDFEESITINLFAPFILARSMQISGGTNTCQKIVNIGDWHTARTDRFAYGVSKAALSGLTLSLAASMAPTTQVNQINLGAILKPKEENGRDFQKHSIPLGRLGRLSEVTNALLMFIKNDYITGQILEVDGGLSIR